MFFLKRDLQRYRGRFSDPTIPYIIVYRFGAWANNCCWGLRQLLLLVYFPFYRILSLLCGIEIPRQVKIGPGLRIYHFGCIVLNAEVVAGTNLTLRHGVTIGNRKNDHDVPVLGDNVDIGAGAKILGAIHIGSNVQIGANAVVLTDVPDNCIAVGVPAIVKHKKSVDFQQKDSAKCCWKD